MTEVCLIYDMDNVGHDILLQTPQRSGIINNCRFTLINQNNIDQLPKETDAVIVLNTPFTDIEISCHQDLTYLISQEAANDRYQWHTHSFKYFSKVYTQWPKRKKNMVPSHGFLTWYIEKSYDDLLKLDPAPKKHPHGVAYIGNKESILIGQVKRNEFVEKLNVAFSSHHKISVDLLGRSYQAPIDNKFDTLHQYHYGLAIENTIIDHYWTEKIADVFLAGALPFYIGPKNIYDYFPKESIIMLDFDDVDKSIEIIQQAIENNEYEKRKEAIEIARHKILNEYNLFAGFSTIINEAIKNVEGKKTNVFFPKNYWDIKPTLIQKIKNKLL